MSPRHPLDLVEKFARAAQLTGPKLLLALSACPTGRGYDPARTTEVAKLAVETGVWPLKEAVHGQATHTYIPKRRPVEDHLILQARFRHLFEPTRQDDAIRHIQDRVNAYWDDVGSAQS